VREIDENCLMLAVFGFAKYSNAAHRLEQGDRLLLYTDGIVEAMDASGKFFGQDSLSDLLRQTSRLPPSEAADRIIASVGQWGRRPRMMTSLCLFATTWGVGELNRRVIRDHSKAHESR
jgi:serine/threonine protein phosphatase PrpC